ncbi:MAG: hypothetical protein ACOX5P_01075 [Bacilli bacterium]
MIVTIAVTSIFFTMVFSVISSLISNYKATERLNKADERNVAFDANISVNC